MKILWAKANKLLPLHSGGDIRSFQILKHLSSSHEVTFISYYDGAQDKPYERELAMHFPSAVTVSIGKNATSFSRSLDYLHHLSSPIPYAVSRFASPPVRQKIGDLLQTGNFDVAIADFLDAAVNFPDQTPVPAILFQHNVESEIWRRHAETETNLVKRLVYGRESRKMLRYERAMIAKFQHIISVSEHDRDIMLRWGSGSNITIVPTGVDVRQYSVSPGNVEMGAVVMFVGAMDWEPNIDAVEFFCREIWHSVVAAVPTAKFLIVGRNPDRRVQKLASSSVEITGRVESVVEQLQKAAVVIVPLRIGGGTRLKIYEAMAAGKAVVSTTVGAEGLDVTPGHDISIADEARPFADAVISLLQNADLRKRYEHAAAVTAGKYDWSVIAEKFGKVIESVACARSH